MEAQPADPGSEDRVAAPDTVQPGARDLIGSGFYQCRSVAQAIVPPELLRQAVACAGVTPSEAGLWHFEVIPCLGNHVLRVRPVRPEFFAEDLPEHALRKVVSRSLDRVKITSARYAQVHLYFRGPQVLCAWRDGVRVFIRRRLLSEDIARIQTQAPELLDALHIPPTPSHETDAHKIRRPLVGDVPEDGERLGPGEATLPEAVHDQRGQCRSLPAACPSPWSQGDPARGRGGDDPGGALPAAFGGGKTAALPPCPDSDGGGLPGRPLVLIKVRRRSAGQPQGSS